MEIYDIVDVKVLDKNLRMIDGRISIYELDEKILLKLEFEENVYAGEDNNSFCALLKIRSDLEKNGIILLCKGCAKNVYPSGMMLDMGIGDKAYLLNIGEQAKIKNVVNIFDRCSIDEYSTIEVQRKFYKCWEDSIIK